MDSAGLEVACICRCKHMYRQSLCDELCLMKVFTSTIDGYIDGSAQLIAINLTVKFHADQISNALILVPYFSMTPPKRLANLFNCIMVYNATKHASFHLVYRSVCSTYPPFNSPIMDQTTATSPV